MLIEYREHGDGRYRVWTEEDAKYGSFRILTKQELQIVVRACTLMGGLCSPATDAGCDPVDMNCGLTLG